MTYKPYPTYKDSGVEWLGDVPKHWEAQRLKYSVELIRDNNILSDNPELPFTGLENIESWTGKLIASEERSVEKGQGILYETGDVLLGKLRPYLAKAHAAKSIGVCSGEFLVLRPRTVTQEYFTCYLLNPGLIYVIDSSTYGVKMPRANWDFVGNLPLLITSIEEQKSISRFLKEKNSSIDTLIEKKQRQIELLQEKRSALITHAVTKGLNPEAKMKDSGMEWLGEVPEHWIVLSLRHVVASINTGSTPPGAEESAFDDEGLKWYTPGDFSEYILLGKSNRSLSREGATMVRLFPKNSVMLVGIGSIGKVALSPETCSCNQQINGIVCGDKINPKYTTYYLKTMQDYLVKCGKYTTLPIINQEETKKLIVCLPPYPEQIDIITFLDRKTAKIDTLIAKINQSIHTLQEYRSALITAAVTGKIDVRESVA